MQRNRCAALTFFKIKVMRKFLALVLIVSAFSACKKEEATTPSYSNNSGPSSPYSTSTASVYSGAFVAGNYTVISTGNRTAMNSNARASFNMQPKEYKEIGPGAEVRSVRLNGQLVSFDKSYQYYQHNDWDINTEQQWDVEGLGPIPSFKFRIHNPTPEAANLDVIPDSVSLSKGFTLHIPGVKNTTPGTRVIIYDMNYKEITSKPMVNGDNTVTFTSSDFSSAGGTGAILIELENSSAYNFYGQDFIFIKAKGWMKQVAFKP
jgi:hypothetical protein